MVRDDSAPDFTTTSCIKQNLATTHIDSWKELKEKGEKKQGGGKSKDAFVVELCAMTNHLNYGFV